MATTANVLIFIKKLCLLMCNALVILNAIFMCLKETPYFLHSYVLVDKNTFMFWQ